MKLTDLNEGDLVHVDDGFSCMKSGEKTVKKDPNGFYVNCDLGQHFLDGQLDHNGELVGIAPCKK